MIAGLLTLAMLATNQHYCVAASTGGWRCSEQPQSAQPLPDAPLRLEDARPFAPPQLSPMQPDIQVDLLLAPDWMAVWSQMPAFTTADRRQKMGNTAKRTAHASKDDTTGDPKPAGGASSKPSATTTPAPGFYLQLGAFSNSTALLATMREWQNQQAILAGQFWRQPRGRLDRLLLGPFNRARAEQLQSASPSETWLRYIDDASARTLEPSNQ